MRLAALAVVAITAFIGVGSSGPPDRGRPSDVVDAVQRYGAALHPHHDGELEQLLRPDFTFHNSDNGFAQDRDGFLAWARILGETYPGFSIAIDDVRVEGERATVRFHPVGARASSAVAHTFVVRVVDGRIRDLWSNYDELGLHRHATAG